MTHPLMQYAEKVDLALTAAIEVVERYERLQAVSKHMRPQAIENLIASVKKLKPALDAVVRENEAEPRDVGAKGEGT